MGRFLERGRKLYEVDRCDLAERELLRELAENPECQLTCALLGLCRIKTKPDSERDTALAFCREAVRLAPAYSFAHYALSYVLERSNQFSDAETAILEALRLDPSIPYYYAHLAWVQTRQKNYYASLESAAAGLRLDAQDFECLFRHGLALKRLGRRDEAEVSLRVALAIDPNNAIVKAHLLTLRI